MILQRFDEKNKPSKEVGKVFLSLIEDTSGQITVMACNSAGEPICAGYLITFMPDGTICREGEVNEDLPYHLDEDGRIKDFTD